MAGNLISGDEWAFYEGFIRAVRHPNGRKPADDRLVLAGIFWRSASRHRFGVPRDTRTGAPWRDLPEEFGKWSSVCRQFRRWPLSALSATSWSWTVNRSSHQRCEKAPARSADEVGEYAENHLAIVRKLVFLHPRESVGDERMPYRPGCQDFSGFKYR